MDIDSKDYKQLTKEIENNLGKMDLDKYDEEDSKYNQFKLFNLLSIFY